MHRQFHHSPHRVLYDQAECHSKDYLQDNPQIHFQLSPHHYSMHPEPSLASFAFFGST